MTQEYVKPEVLEFVPPGVMKDAKAVGKRTDLFPQDALYLAFTILPPKQPTIRIDLENIK